MPLAAGREGWMQMIAGELELCVHGTSGSSIGRLRQGDGLGLKAALMADLTAGPRVSLTALDTGADLLCFELR